MWRKDSNNVLRVQRYHYFPQGQGLAAQSSHFIAGTDEDGPTGQLAVIAGVLLGVHKDFFAQPEGERDVRQLLQQRKRSILAGCVVCFSRVHLRA